MRSNNVNIYPHIILRQIYSCNITMYVLSELFRILFLFNEVVHFVISCEYMSFANIDFTSSDIWDDE